MVKYGGAVHVYVDKHSKDGIVYVKGHTRESAMLATKAIHGRYFDGEYKFYILIQCFIFW